MFCRNCGKEVPVQAVVCVACGCPPRSGNKFCQNCGTETNPAATICVKCGVQLATAIPVDAKSKLTAGLLGIFLGWLGIHRFYLGYTGIGIAQILVSILTCGTVGWLWGLIDGILILTGSINKDVNGQPLKD